MNVPGTLLASPVRARLSVENFLLLADSGAFAEYAKTELIDGDIYVMNAQYSDHARAKTRLSFALTATLSTLRPDLEVLVEVSVRLNDDTMPEPDIVVTNWRGEDAVPVDTVALVVEVADTTLDNDLGRKADLYAAAGVPEYWVIDLNERRALLHELPSADGYAGQLDILLDETLASATIEGLEVSSVDLIA